MSFGIYQAISLSSSKMVMGLEGRPKHTYAFEVFHTPPGSIEWPQSEHESVLSLGQVPSLAKTSFRTILSIENN